MSRFRKLTLVFLASLLASGPAFSQPRKVVIAAENDAGPWSYRDGTGYANDIVRAALEKVGYQVTFEVFPYARCKLLAENGEVLACFTTSRESLNGNAKDFIFPKHPLINVHNILWVRRGDGITSCDEKQWPLPLKVAEVNGYEYFPHYEVLKRQKKIWPTTVSSESSGLQMLLQKRVDAAIVTVDEVKTIELVKAGYGIEGEIAKGCDLGLKKGYLAFSRHFVGAEKVLADFDKGFEMLKQHGDLRKIREQWIQRLNAE